MVKNAPFSDRQAEEHFNKGIEIFGEVGAKYQLGQALLWLGLLHKANNRNGKACERFLEAAHLFQGCVVHLYQKPAQEELAAVE